MRENLAALRCPVRAYSFDDDTFYAPRAAVEAFTAMLGATAVEHRHVVPDEHGLRRIGHFGFFSPRARALWDDLGEFLSDATARAAARGGSELRSEGALR